jgi:hypothetical protein
MAGWGLVPVTWENGRAYITMGVFWVTTLINGIMSFLGEVLGTPSPDRQHQSTRSEQRKELGHDFIRLRVAACSVIDLEQPNPTTRTRARR